MTSLPEALAPWSAWLKWFAPELAADLGSLLQRLQPLLGPFQGHDPGGEPQWQGLDDLRTRGPYERLLATEWLLADEFPDEFLRRAVSGEHMFLAPRPSRRRSRRTIVALFDAGPLQLGAPRLGHIVLWILLARRAVQAQAELRWGVLQLPGELQAAADAQSLKALLDMRSFTTPGAAHLEQWQAALAAADCVIGERWLLGSPQLDVNASAFSHRVHFQKDLHGTQLDVSLIERGAQRSVSLRLPKQESVLALLRGSFDATLAEQPDTADAGAIALQRPPIVSYDGTRVAIALRDEPAAAVMHIPRWSDEPLARPRVQRWSYGYSALAANLAGKGLGVVLSDRQRLRFWPTSMSIQPHPPQETFHAPGSTAAWLPSAWLRGSQHHRICVIDHSRRLLRWDATVQRKQRLTGDHELHLVTEAALALVQLNKDLAAIAHHEDCFVWFSRISSEGAPSGTKLVCEAPPDAQALFGRGCFCAVRVASDHWCIANWNDDNEAYSVRIPDELRVIGVLRDQRGRVGLLTLDERHLRLHAKDGSHELLYTAPARVASHTVCPNSGLVAMLTLDRQLIAFSAATRELRLCLQTGRGSHAGA